MLTDWVEEEERAARSRAQQWAILNGGQPVLDPRSIAEVAAGYFWDPAAGSGSGGAGFLLPEGNGKSAFNQITPNAGVAPLLGTVNGQAVATYTNATPDKLARTALVQSRGFTGSSMIWGWINAATAPGLVFGHFRTNQQFAIQLNGSDVRVYVHDGVTLVESRFPNPTYASGPFYYEGIFDEDAVSPTDRIQLAIDRVAIVPSVAGSVGVAMQDLTEFLTFGGCTSDASNFNYNATFSCGVMGVTDGIPSAAARNLLFEHKRLK